MGTESINISRDLLLITTRHIYDKLMMYIPTYPYIHFYIVLS